MQYYQGTELPDRSYTLKDSAGKNLDLSLNWTFSMTVIGPGSQRTRFIKTTGFTGYDAAQTPNLVVTWATSGELNLLGPGEYMAKITATYTPTGKTRVIKEPLYIRP